MPPEKSSGDAPISQPLWRPQTRRWLCGVLAFTVFYTALRYAVFGSVPHHKWPLFLGNKVLSFAGIILLALSYLIGRDSRLTKVDTGGRLALIRFCGLGGFTLIGMHVFASLMVLNPEHFPKFYNEARELNFIGQLSMLMGVISLWCFCLPVVTTIPNMFRAIGEDRWRRNQRMGYFGLAVAAAHVGIMGYLGWMQPANWYGYMPPITLLSFVVAMIPLFLRLRKDAEIGKPD